MGDIMTWCEYVGGILHLYDFTDYYFGQNTPLKLALILFLPKIRVGPLVARKLS